MHIYSRNQFWPQGAQLPSGNFISGTKDQPGFFFEFQANDREKYIWCCRELNEFTGTFCMCFKVRVDENSFSVLTKAKEGFDKWFQRIATTGNFFETEGLDTVNYFFIGSVLFERDLHAIPESVLLPKSIEMIKPFGKCGLVNILFDVLTVAYRLNILKERLSITDKSVELLFQKQ